MAVMVVDDKKKRMVAMVADDEKKTMVAMVADDEKKDNYSNDLRKQECRIGIRTH